MPEINGEALVIFANIDKAKSLGWKPKVKFREGHENLMKYLKKLYNENVFPKDFMDNINTDNIKI
jgi:hypothetical protein